MAKLGVALTERWVAAEEREIEPAAKVEEPRIFTKEMFKSIGEARDGDMILMPVDPLLSRLLAAWEVIIASAHTRYEASLRRKQRKEKA